MKKKILISILVILILLLVSAVAFYNIFSNNANVFKNNEKKESEKAELDKDIYRLDNINKSIIKYDSLELSDVFFKNEDGKSKISLSVKNIADKTFTNDKIQVELYNGKNDLIGSMILNIKDDIAANEEITLSQEIEPEIKDVSAIAFTKVNEDLLGKEEAKDTKEDNSEYPDFDTAMSESVDGVKTDETLEELMERIDKEEAQRRK